MKCLKCGRTILIKQRVEMDKKTKKRWVISACSACDAGFDLEDFDPVLHSYLRWEWHEELDDEAQA